MNKRLYAVASLLVLCATAALRVWHLGSTGWQYDEIVYHQVASNLIGHAGLTEKVTYKTTNEPFLYQPPWYPYLLAGWFDATGKATIYSARVLGIALSLCSLILAWLLVRRQRGAKVALYATVPLAFDGWLLYVDRVSYIENLVMVVILAAFLFYQRALDDPSWQRFALAGLLFGLAGCLKYTGVYVIMAAALSWLIMRRNHRGHLVMLGTALAVLALDQLTLTALWGNAYLTETSVQIQRVLGLRKSGGTLTSPAALAHLLFAQYHIFTVSFVIGLSGAFFVVRYLLRCYRARSWEPVRSQAVLFSWALAGMLTFGLSNLRLPQYFSLILIPLYLLFWTEISHIGRRSLRLWLCGAAVMAGLGSFWLSTHAQEVNPLHNVQHYADDHIPARAVVIADEQVGDLIRQPYCREQQPQHCVDRATYAITWDTYLQSTQHLGTTAYAKMAEGARPLWSSRGFSGTVTVWKLRKPAPAEPVLGIDVEADQDYPPAQAATDGRRVLAYIRSHLHAGAVSIVWDLCSPRYDSDVVRRCRESLSPPDVRIIVREGLRQHLRIQLRPLVRVGPPSGWNDPARSWEGHIHPADQEAWFTSLLAAEHPYLRLLRGVPGAQFVIATELRELVTSSYWHPFALGARAACGCQVSTALLTTDYARGLLPPAGDPGVDWYPSLDVAGSASQQRVTATWEASLADVPRSILARTTLDEESIRATAGAYHNPDEWNRNGPPDAEVQARYFIAACQAAAHYHMRAIYFYEIPLNDDPARPLAFPAFFVGNPGSAAIRDCARILTGDSHP